MLPPHPHPPIWGQKNSGLQGLLEALRLLVDCNPNCSYSSTRFSKLVVWCNSFLVPIVQEIYEITCSKLLIWSLFSMTADANIWCPGGGYRQCGKYSFGACSLQSPSKDSLQIWPLCKLVTFILHFQFGSISLFTKNTFRKKSIEIKYYWELWDEELNERKASQFL